MIATADRLAYYRAYNARPERKEAHRNWARTNKDKINALLRERRQSNKEYWRQYWRDYRKSHPGLEKKYRKDPERKKAMLKEWSILNKDKRHAASKRYREAHPDRIKQQFQSWSSRNVDYLKQQRKSYALKNSEKIRNYMRGYSRRRYAIPEIKQKLIDYSNRYSKSHPEVRRKCFKNWTQRHPEKYKLCLKHGRMIRRARKAAATINPKSIAIFIAGTKSRRLATCYYCKKKVSTKAIHFDHITALSKGGSHSVENLCVSCPRCNLTKSAKRLKDFVTLGQQLLEL